MGKLLKKSIVGLTFLLVLLLLVSSVNASNNGTDDIVSVETDETVSIEESSYDSDEFASMVEMLEDESDEVLSSVKDDEISSFDENNNVLGVNLPPYTAYNVKIDHVEKDNNEYTIYTFISDVSHGYDEDYVFDMNFYDSNDVLKASGRFHGTYSYPSLIGRTIDANQLEQGIYTIKLVNYVDKHVMDTAELVIGPTYVDNKYKNVNINAPNAYYNQNKKISYSFEGNFKGSFNIYKDNSLKYSKKIDTSGYRDGIFKYNKHSYTYAISNLKDIGKYVVKIVDSTGKVIAQSTFKIVKAPTISISDDFSTQMGAKETIYLHVFDKDWNEADIGGTAKFKINGKTYTAKVKNSLAQVKVKLPFKAKTYKCTAKYLGDKHFKGSSEKFTITVKKDITAKKTTTVNKKKTTSFTVVVPVKLNQYTSKTVGKYKIVLHKYITKHSTYDQINITLDLYKNNKKIKSSSSVYKTKLWFHLKSGSWVYSGVNNYGKISYNKITYNQFLAVDKAKVTVWVKS